MLTYTLLDSTQCDNMEAVAHSLAERNNVEEAWVLRGVIDALAGDERGDLNRDDPYYDAYMRGFNAIQEG